MAKRYQIGKIRTLLMRGFTPGELRNLCYDEFRLVYDNLAENTGKSEIVSELLEYAERKGEFDRLLAWAQEQNLTQYAEYEPYTSEPTPVPPTPTPLPSPLPPVPTPLPHPLRGFLGHATHGNPAIVALYHWLSEAGVEAWLDEEDLLPGQIRQQEIVKQVRAADVVLICLTHESIIASGEVHKTINHVLDVIHERTAESFLLIPLRLDSTPVPEPLSEWQSVSLADPRGYEKLLRALQRHAEAKAKAEAERKAKEEAERIAAERAEAERKAKEEAEAKRIATEKDEAERIAAQKAEAERIVREKAEAKRKSKEEAEAERKRKPQISISTPQPLTPKPQTLPSIHSFEPEMIFIPAGEFLMGSDPKKDKHAEDVEQPQHILYLPNYYMAKMPVTNAQYAAFVQATNYQPPEHWKGKGFLGIGKKEIPQGKTDHSVVDVSWDDALAYCRWLTEATGKPYRLPSEAEWEKGARGTDSRIYPWGNQWDTKRCNSREGGKGSTMPVGAYPDGASPYRLLDMAGNVWEWCSTIWQEKAYPFQVQDEWTKTYLDRTNVRRVLRGGAFDDGPAYVRCVVRSGYYPFDRNYDIGFRVVLPPK